MLCCTAVSITTSHRGRMGGGTSRGNANRCGESERVESKQISIKSMSAMLRFVQSCTARLKAFWVVTSSAAATSWCARARETYRAPLCSTTLSHVLNIKTSVRSSARLSEKKMKILLRPVSQLHAYVSITIHPICTGPSQMAHTRILDRGPPRALITQPHLSPWWNI